MISPSSKFEICSHSYNDEGASPDGERNAQGPERDGQERLTIGLRCI